MAINASMNTSTSMKAMILAAGLGTRMRPLTDTTPKPLLKVAGKPLIVWHIEALKRAGIVDIVINCAWLADVLMQALGDGSQFGVHITWSRETEALETAGGIIQALPHLGNVPFLLVNGDVWTRFDYSALTQPDLLGNHLAHLCLVDNPLQHPTGDFVLCAGQVYRDESHLPIGLSNPNNVEAERLTFAGISVLSPKLFNQLSQGKAPLAPILRNAMDAGLVTGQALQTAWVDVGTPERLAQLDAQILRGAI